MLFQPTNITPSTFAGMAGGTIAAADLVNITWQINGNDALTALRIQIFQNDAASTIVHDTDVVNVSPAYYGTDAKGNPAFYTYAPNVTWGSWGIVDGNDYKLKITQYWGGVTDEAHSVSQYSDSAFIARTTPTITLGEITTPIEAVSQLFSATYQQAQGDSISWIRWQFAEVTNQEAEALTDEDVLILDDTGYINTGYLAYTADGMITGNTYAIKATAASSNGVEVTTGWQSFNVSYVEAAATGGLTAQYYPKGEGVLLSWAGNTDIPGEASEGADYAISDGALALTSGSVTWGTVDGSPMSFASPFTTAWRGNVSQVYNSMSTLSSEGSINVMLNCGNILVVGGNIPGGACYFTLQGNTAAFGGYLIRGSTPLDGAVRCATLINDNILFIGGDFTGFGCTFSIENSIPAYISDVTDLDGSVNSAAMLESVLYLGGAFTGYAATYSTDVNGVVAQTAVVSGNLATYVNSEVKFAQPINSNDTQLGFEGVMIATSTATIMCNSDLSNIQAPTYVYLPNGDRLTDAVSIVDIDGNGRFVIGTLSHGVIAAYWWLPSQTQLHTEYIYETTNPIYTVRKISGNRIFVSGQSGRVYNYSINDVITSVIIKFELDGIISGISNARTAEILDTNTIAVANLYSIASVTLDTEQEDPDNGDMITVFDGTVSGTLFSISAKAIAAGANIYARAALSIDGAQIVSNGVATPLTRNGAFLGGIAQSLAFSPNGEFLFVGGEFEGYGVLYSVSGSTATYLSDIDALDEPVIWSQFSPDNTLLALGTASKSLLFSITNGVASLLTTLNTSFDFLRFEPTGTYAVAANGSLLSVYSINTGQIVSSTTVIGANKLCGSFDTTGAYFIVGFDTAPYGGYYAFSGGNLSYIGQLPQLSEAVNSISFNADGTLLATIGQYNVNIYNLNNGVITYGGSPFTPPSEIYEIAFGGVNTAYISAATSSLVPIFSCSDISGARATLAGLSIDIASTGVQIKNGETLLASYYIPVGARSAIVWAYIGETNSRVGATFYNGSTRTSVNTPIAVQQAEITDITLNSPQIVDWVYVVGGYYDISGNNYTPSWTDAETKFYANFESSLQGGTTDVPGYYNDIYRLRDGDATAIKVAHLPTGARQMLDFGARSSDIYDYELFYNSAANAYSVPAIVNDVCYRSRKYMLYEAVQDADNPNLYHVLRYFAFQGNISGGTVSNGNTPTFLNNFTKYRLRQPSSICGKSGVLQALLGITSQGEYYDDHFMQDQLYDASMSKNTFFLKDTKGNLYNVHISQPITQTIDISTLQQQVSVSVPWEEVGDVSGVALVQYPTDEGWETNAVLSARLKVNSNTGELSALYPSAYTGTTFGMRGNILTASTPETMTTPNITIEDGSVIATLEE